MRKYSGQMRKYSHRNGWERLRHTLPIKLTPAPSPTIKREPPTHSFSLKSDGFGPYIQCLNFYGFRNKASVPTLATFIQNSTGSPSQSNE